MKIYSSILFLTCFFCLSCYGQTKHTYQFGYGKQFLEFKAPSHNFLISYQRNYKSKVFWSIRSEFATEEDKYRDFTDGQATFLQYGQGDFVYEDRVSTDEVNSGFISLKPLSGFYNKFKIYPNIGYNFFSTSRVFGLNVQGGTGISYEKLKGLYSEATSPFLEVIENGYELETPADLYIEGYKRGFDFFLNFGFQVYFNLKNDFQVGFDATIETYDFGGFPITHNFFLAKKM